MGRSWGDGGIQRLSSGNYRATFSRNVNGKRQRITRTFEKRTDAADWLSEQKQLQPRSGMDAGITVGQWVERYFTEHAENLRPNTQALYRYRCNLITETIGTVKLSHLDAARISQWMVQLKEIGKPPGQRTSMLKFLRTVLAAAMRVDLLTKNPAKQIRVAKSVKTQVEYFSRSEVSKLVKYCHAEPLTGFKLYCLIALDSGARPIEILSLNWSDIDTDTGQISITKSITSTWSGETVLPPKTNRANRKVLLTDASMAMLARYRQTITDDRPLVFRTKTGRRLTHKMLSKLWQAEIKRGLGIDKRLYSLRHTSATMLLEAGVNIRILADRLGHETPTITLAHYAFAMPSQQEVARAAMDKILHKHDTRR